jgi:3-oxo-5-alpha-steroid 4-dehydrogenase 1
VKELTVFNFLLAAWFGLAAIIFVLLFFFVAPYGRHIRHGWGQTIGNRMGWILMESPAPISFAVCFLLGSNAMTISGVGFLILWEAHYVHRSFIYPFSLSRDGRPMPLAIVSFGFFFNVMNGYLNGRYLFNFSGNYGSHWLADPRFIIGSLIFVIGFVINRQADRILRRLRGPGDSGYKIPYEGFYRWISCPNYAGELVIWVGWAIATWSLPGLAFAFWTAANLVPRARAHHAWYRATFPDYPAERKALVPGLW